jgi:hypothetical protein
MNPSVDVCSCLRGQFIPSKGLDVLPGNFIEISIGERIKDLKRFDWVGCTGFVLSDDILVPTQGAALWKVPNFDKNSAFCFTHLFGGAFNGWSRATTFLSSTNIIDIMNTTSIDHDSEVMKVWCAQHGISITDADISCDFQAPKVLGIQSPVSDVCWMNVCRFDNMVFTLSPPCISWSPEGLRSGLHSEHGIAFVEAAAKVRCIRPVLFFVECSDVTPTHKHFPIMKAFLLHAGYREIWTSVSDIDEMCSMHRRRWLSVWCRLDIEVSMYKGKFKLIDTEGVAWDHPLFQFVIPPCLLTQLTLTPDLLGIYGDIKLLPAGLKQRLPDDPSPHDVLLARCLPPGTTMPTLNASYTRQHKLSSAHVAAKGIFASLKKVGDGFSFHCPLQFIMMLGATTHGSIPMDKQLETAFSHLGNGIAVPHACLTILLGLSLVACIEVDIRDMVLKCWNCRVTPLNSIVAEDANHVWIIPHDRFACDLTLMDCKTGGADILLVSNHITIPIEKQATFHDFVKYFGLSNAPIRFLSENVDLPGDTKIDDLIGKAFLICAEGRPIAFFKVQVAIILESFTDGLSSCVPTHIDVPSQSDTEPDPKAERFVIQDGNVFTSTVQDILSSCDQEVCLVHCHHTCTEVLGFPCCIVQSEPQEGFVLVAVYDGDRLKDVTLPFRCDRADLDAAFGLGNMIKINGIAADSQSFVLANGDFLVIETSTNPKKAKSTDSKTSRIELAKEHGLEMGSDEASFILGELSKVTGLSTFPPILLVDGMDHHSFRAQVGQLGSCIRDSKYTVCPILIGNHWAGIEIEQDDEQAELLNICLINFPPCNWDPAATCFHALQHLGFEIVLNSWIIQVHDGLCGWAIFKRWTSKFGITCDDCHDLCMPPCEAFESLIAKNVCAKTAAYGLSWRLAFFQREIFACVGIFFGATGNESMDTKEDKKADPWLEKDPWKRPTRSCRWEDLKLLDHHFTDKDGRKLDQIHRLQLNSGLGGLCFCTHKDLQAAIDAAPKKPTALLLPNSDKSDLKQYATKMKVSQPVEVVVSDPNSQSVCKRQVIVLEICPDVSLQQPKPTYTSKLPDISEIVFECDCRLASKEFFAQVNQNPIDAFRNRLIDQFNLKSVNLYGHRVLNFAKDYTMHQFMCKIPSSQRADILKASGQMDLIARDFIPKGGEIQDTTVLPRFFDCTKTGKRASCENCI